MSEDEKTRLPTDRLVSKTSRAALQLVGAVPVPVLGAVLSTIASTWGEYEQGKANSFFRHWLEMLQDEIREKEQTIAEIIARLDLRDEQILKRLESKEYQSILKKAFRDWAGTESEEKRVWIRNILTNAAAASITSDDVVKLFIEWLDDYSELHFHVIAAVYNSNGITRAGIWKKIGKELTREDSPEAGLYRLLIRQLNMGGIIRQHRMKNYAGQFMTQPSARKSSGERSGPKPMESAFDDVDRYELSELGAQFVHYAMTDLPIKIGAGSPA